MSIDFHVHPWTRAFMMKNDPIIKAAKFFKMDMTKFPSTTDQLVEDMEEAGVSQAVILGQDTHATANPNFRNYTLKNDYLYSLTKKHEGKFVPFAGVDPNAGHEAVLELKRVVRDLGFRGLKIHSSANSVFPNDQQKMYPIYEFCEEAGVPILFHTGTTGLGDCDMRYSKPEFLDEVCQEFPDLKIVMAHFGWPWSDVALAIALRNPNVCLDVSGWRPRYLPQNIMPYLNGILQDRFLFGTDYPMLKPTDWVNDFAANLKPKLKPGVAEKLLSGNAKRVLAG